MGCRVAAHLETECSDEGRGNAPHNERRTDAGAMECTVQTAGGGNTAFLNLHVTANACVLRLSVLGANSIQ